MIDDATLDAVGAHLACRLRIMVLRADIEAAALGLHAVTAEMLAIDDAYGTDLRGTLYATDHDGRVSVYPIGSKVAVWAVRRRSRRSTVRGRSTR